MEDFAVSCDVPDMKRADAIARLRAHEVELRQLGVEELYLFGSTARDDADDDSDVDLFFDHQIGALGLFGVMDVGEHATRILGRRADVMTRRSIHPGLKRADRGNGRPHLLMVSRILSLRFSDIIEAIENVRGLLDEVPLEAFEHDWQKRWLIERGIEIISEASRHIPDEVKAVHPTIPWVKVAAIGNVLRHAYDRIAPDILWKLVRDDLPPLAVVCRAEFDAALARERQT